METRPVFKLPEIDSEEGNVFSIIAKVSKTLKKVGMKDEAAEFINKAFGAESYQAVITLAAEYVEIEEC